MKRSDYKSNCEICSICCTFWLMVSLLICNLIYFFWSIIIVSNNTWECPSTFILPYMILSIIFSIPRYISFKGFHWIANELEDTVCKGVVLLVLLTIIEICLYCFGALVLFQQIPYCLNNTIISENINSAPIVKFSFASFIIQIIMSILFIITPCYICFKKL